MLIEEVQDIIKAKISQDENLGEQVGGSGHLGHVSYEIDNISKPERIQIDTYCGWKVVYTYTIAIVTEFTYYPDNPPYEYTYKKTIIIDEEGKIIDESPKELPLICNPNKNLAF